MAQNTDSNNTRVENPANSYKKRLNSWVITRKVSEQERQVVARFRSRSDAEGYIQHIRQLIPNAAFELLFDCQKQEVVA